MTGLLGRAAKVFRGVSGEAGSTVDGTYGAVDGTYGAVDWGWCGEDSDRCGDARRRLGEGSSF